MASEQFGVLVRDFPVKANDADARMLAYLIWSAKVAEFGAVPVSGEADLDIKEWIAEGDILMVRVLGLAERV
jgi:hypothetical protein